MNSTEKIRAVFVLNDFIIGGVQRLYIELFTYLNPDVYELHLVTLVELPGKVDMYESIPKHVHIHRLSFRSLSDVSGYRAYARTIRLIQPDILLTSLFFANTVSRVVGMFHRYAIISIEHNTNTWKTRPQILVDKMLALRSRLIIATSNTVKEFASDQARISVDKFRVIHNSIDMVGIRRQQEAVTNRAELLGEFGFPVDVKVFINVARLTHQKNQPMLIEAFARFAKEFPDYRLLILGEGPQRQALEGLIHQHQAGKVIALAGARMNIVSYYAISNFFISTSFIEGFGIAHAEALAAGLPLVSTKTAGPDEMIEEGVNGIFTEMTVESIYDGLVQMATVGVRATTEEVRASVARFDSPKIAGEYDALMREVLGIL